MANSSPGNTTDISEYTKQAVTVILHIMRNLKHSGMEMTTDVELSYPQILVMYALLEKGKATMTELSSWLKISHGVATRTVDRLVEKDIVERSQSKEDRRVVYVSLSESGKDHAEKMIVIHLEKMNDVFMGVGKEKREAFMELLVQIDGQLEG